MAEAFGSEEERESQIAAYLVERQGYVARGLDDRVAEVDRILARLGHKTEKTKTEKRPRARGETRERK